MDYTRVKCSLCELSCSASILKNKKEIKCPCDDCIVKAICLEVCDSLENYSVKIKKVQTWPIGF